MESSTKEDFLYLITYVLVLAHQNMFDLQNSFKFLNRTILLRNDRWICTVEGDHCNQEVPTHVLTKDDETTRVCIPCFIYFFHQHYCMKSVNSETVDQDVEKILKIQKKKLKLETKEKTQT
jgi:hypothetical protein